MSAVVWATDKVRDDQEYLEINTELRIIKDWCIVMEQYDPEVDWPSKSCYNITDILMTSSMLLKPWYIPPHLPPKGFFWRAYVWWDLVEESLFCELVKENQVIPASGGKGWREHDVANYLIFIRGGFWLTSPKGVRVDIKWNCSFEPRGNLGKIGSQW